MRTRRRRVVTGVVVAALLVTVVGVSATPPWQLQPRFDFTIAPIRASLSLNTHVPSQMPLPPGVPALSDGAIHAMQTGALTVVIVIVALILAVIAWRLWPRRLKRDETPPPLERVELQVELDTAVREARSYLQLHRETGDIAKGITLAWSALEQVAAESGHLRQPTQTASEFTASLLRDLTGAEQGIGEMLALYHRARFGDQATVHALEVTDLDRVDELLGGLVSELDADAAAIAEAKSASSAAEVLEGPSVDEEDDA